jgi:membrane associated rhomboid family serine protease
VPAQRYPIANWALMLITIALSIAAWSTDDRSPLARALGQTAWSDALILYRHDFTMAGLFGNVFMHGGVIHLLGNMVFLFCFGNAVDAKLGHWLFLASYFLCGATAGLAWLALGSGGAVVGASGAIMGIVGIFLVYFPRNDVYVFYWWHFRVGSFSLSSYWLILAYVAFDLWGAFASDALDNVAYASHVAGAAIGILCAVILLLTGLVCSSDTEQNLLQLLNIQRARR